MKYSSDQPCRQCGGLIDDPWELTGTLGDEVSRRLYPLTLIGPKAAMQRTYLHKACVQPYFQYLTDNIWDVIGDL